MSIISKFFGLFGKKDVESITLESLFKSNIGFKDVTISFSALDNIGNVVPTSDWRRLKALQDLMYSSYPSGNINSLYVPINKQSYSDFRMSNRVCENFSHSEKEYLNILGGDKITVDSLFMINVGVNSILIEKFSDEWFLVRVIHRDKVNFYYKCDTFDGVKELLGNLYDC